MNLATRDKKIWQSQRFILLALLLVHTIVAGLHISKQDVTTDERDYYVYGIRWLHGQVERVDKLDDSKSPVTVLSAIPRSILQILKPGYKAKDNGRQDLLMGRYMLVVYTWIIAIYFFSWTRQLYGNKAWILPLLFFLFDPLVISYSMIVISDMATGACVIATLYHISKYYQTRELKHYLFFCFWIGFSCVAKASLIFMLPCLLIIWLILLVTKQIQFYWKRGLYFSLGTIAAILLIINAAYFFKNTFFIIDNHTVLSSSFKSLFNTFPFLKHMPIPVPKTYFDSFDLLAYHKEIGGGLITSSYPGVYLNGETRLHGGFWYYYFVVAWYKLPIATILLLIATLFSGVVFFNKTNFLKKHIWYVIPTFFFLFILSFANSFQIGLRHILMIYPLLFLSAAGAVSFLSKRFKHTYTIVTVGFITLVISIALYYPDFIPYTNELVTYKKMVYKKMNDANVDYSQSLMYIPEYIKNHPGTEEATATPKPGRYIIAIQEMLPYGPLLPNAYTWFQKLEPIDCYKHNLLIYSVTEQDLLKAGLK